MPIYEYQCQQCGHELERIQRMSDEPLKDCPACEKPELRKLISAAAFRLKGAGWYETDFKQGEKRNLADSGNDAPKSSENSDKSATSTESGKSEPTKPEQSKSDSGSSGKKDAGTPSSSSKTSKPAKESNSSSA